MHPPHLRQTVIVIAGETPNSCSNCDNFSDSICARYEQEVSIKQVCDGYTEVVA